MSEVILIVLLGGLNVFQIIYWSRQTHRLIDKVMSRNYAEYVSVEKFQATPPPVKKEDTPPAEEKDEELDLLNKQFAGFY